MEEIENAINYAKQQGWNTLEKAITGGINFLASDYINQGQNTLYLQKFDVENQYNGLYYHQYMQNVMAAQSEGNTLRKTYVSINSVGSAHTFIIPLYKNMPSTACSRPDGSSNATVSGDIVQINANGGLNMRNAPNGSIIGAVSSGEIVTRIEKASSKVAGTYWDKIRRANGEEGYVARQTYDNEAEYKLYLLPLGDSGNSGGTGNTGGNDTTSYKLGDVNNDGNITASDYVLIKNHIMGTTTLNDNAKGAADVNKDGNISASDYVLVKNYIMGVITSF